MPSPEKSRQTKQYDTIVTRREDNVRANLDKLQSLLEKEFGFPLKTYSVIHLAVQEALNSRKKKPIA